MRSREGGKSSHPPEPSEFWRKKRGMCFCHGTFETDLEKARRNSHHSVDHGFLEERRRTQDIGCVQFGFGKREGSAPIDLSSTCFSLIKKEVTDRREKEWAVRGIFICRARAGARIKRYGIWHRCSWDNKSSRRKSMYSAKPAANPPSHLHLCIANLISPRMQS